MVTNVVGYHRQQVLRGGVPLARCRLDSEPLHKLGTLSHQTDPTGDRQSWKFALLICAPGQLRCSTLEHARPPLES
jgi:hypothetical protein